MLELAPERPHGRRQVGDLLQVGLGESVELRAPGRREGDPYDALARGVGTSLDEPILDRAVDQPHRAVVTQDEVVGDVADRRTGRIGMAPDREQQLVLGAGQAGRLGLLLAPAQEAPQPGA